MKISRLLTRMTAVGGGGCRTGGSIGPLTTQELSNEP